MNKNIPIPPQYIKDFEQLGFGMFVHFGLYSLLNSGEWVCEIHKLDKKEYATLIDKFNIPTMEHIVNTAKAAGCKYICITTRHHDGFSLYDTKGLNQYDAPHSPSGRDLIAEFTELCRKADIVPFFYHTTLDWYNPDFYNDFDSYLEYLYRSVEILCTNYGKIGGLWFDGNWSRPDADWKEDRLYKMIHSYQPEAMIINNTGLSARGKMGEEEIDAVTFERGMPHPLDLTGRTKYVSGEMCETLCDHWGVADDLNFKSVKQLIEELCDCRKVGANFLLNIGPSGDGTVSKMQEAIMESLGRWMSVYGRAIYNGRPFKIYDDRKDFLLKDAFDPNTLYLFKFDPGSCGGDKNVSLGFSEESANILPDFQDKVKSVKWMDQEDFLPFSQDGTTLKLNLPGFMYGQNLVVRVAEIKI